MVKPCTNDREPFRFVGDDGSMPPTHESDPRPSRTSQLTALALLGATRPAAPLLVGRAGVRPFRASWTAAARALTPRARTLIPVDTRFRGGRVRGEWCGTSAAAGSKILYYLHGGGYSICSPATHRHLVASLAQATARPAFSLQYRTAPKYRFPAASDDTLRGYEWLLAQGIAAHDIAVVGDSTGGHLALGLLGDLRQRDLPMPGAVVAFSPIIDGTLRTSVNSAVCDPIFPRRTACAVVRRYLDSTDDTDHRVDVRNIAGPGLPPILIQAGEREMFAADARAFDVAMTDAGQQCHVQIWPGQVHAFQAMYPLLPEARAAIGQAARFIAEATSAREN